MQCRINWENCTLQYLVDGMMEEVLELSRTIVGAAKPAEQQECDFAFIAHARADVPRLIELVGEMAYNKTRPHRHGGKQA